MERTELKSDKSNILRLFLPMEHLNPDKLQVNFIDGATTDGPITPRAYTLTHLDMTGDLFLAIGKHFNVSQISGFYTRLMRDEVLAKWEVNDQKTVHVLCHVQWRPGLWAVKMARADIQISFAYGFGGLLVGRYNSIGSISGISTSKHHYSLPGQGEEI